jgi:phosphatidate cytidylyltransferase
MLRTRLWMGTVLALLAAGSLMVDEWLAPGYFPFLFLLIAGLGLAACSELLSLLEPARRPPAWLCGAGVLGLVSANWLAHVFVTSAWSVGPWEWVLGTYVVLGLCAFLVEMAAFREPGGSVVRIALTLWLAAYLGLLPSFLAQLRWLKASEPSYGTIALALAIFVPKFCDIGAYFTGRFLGRHPMTPVLSPKKTWEGAAGGLAAATATTIVLDRMPPVHWLREDLGLEIAFGVSVGIAAMLGDLAESLIKRDCGRKDASQVVPGFGGILDVVDSVLFAAPVVYVWLRIIR